MTLNIEFMHGSVKYRASLEAFLDEENNSFDYELETLEADDMFVDLDTLDKETLDEHVLEQLLEMHS